MSKKATKTTVKALSGAGSTAGKTKTAASPKTAKAKKGISGPFGIFRLNFSTGGSIQKPN